MISKRPSGAITSRKAAIMGTTLGASLKAGSTIEKSGGGAAMTKPSGAIAAAPTMGSPGRLRNGSLNPSARRSFAHSTLPARYYQDLLSGGILPPMASAQSTRRNRSVKDRVAIGRALTRGDNYDTSDRKCRHGIRRAP